jgi:hypothetical protein
MRPIQALLLAAFAAGCAASQHSSAQSGGQLRAQASGGQSHADLQVQPVDGLKRVVLVNDVASCITLTPQELLLIGSVEVGIYALTHLRSIAECGCMATTLEYRVTQKQEEPSLAIPPGVPALDPYQRVLGSVELRPDTRSLSLVVSPDRNLYGTESLTLTVACLGPE